MFPTRLIRSRIPPAAHNRLTASSQAAAGICAALLPPKPHVFKGKAHLPHHLGTGKSLKQ
jgi:hypothetical protein